MGHALLCGGAYDAPVERKWGEANPPLRKGDEMRRAILLLLAATAVLAVAAGAVVAATSTCTGGACLGTRAADTITGSDIPAGDRIAGLEGDDAIDGRAGADVVYADEGADIVVDNGAEDRGADVVYGDEGNDTIDVRNHSVGGPADPTDEVRCGPGKRDKVFYDGGNDVVGRDCEIKRPG